VIATDGGKGGDPVVREAESRRAARVISRLRAACPTWCSGATPTVSWCPTSDLVAQIRAEVRARRPGWLLAPSPFEVHPDHRALCMAAIEAASELPVELGFFEIGQPLMPDRFVDITAVMPRKRAAMACFASQIDVQRYDEQVEATNRLRSYTLGPDVVYAEALWFPPAEARKGVKQVVDALARRLAWRMGVEPDPT
jgi:LmbE family N-acetylglucosaminyl deacetylase